MGSSSADLASIEAKVAVTLSQGSAFDIVTLLKSDRFPMTSAILVLGLANL